MNEQEALLKMVAPGQNRKVNFWGGVKEGVIQIILTRACDRSCYGCTQGSNLGGKPMVITLKNFEIAVKSLTDYFGVVGIFGGNPALHPKFYEICQILAENIPFSRRGIWCNHPKGYGSLMRKIFNPAVSNLNVHRSKEAFDEFKKDWPESRPFGLDKASRHSPVFISMKDLKVPESERWNMISNCDINQHWSAIIGQFRSKPRAWFCEIAEAQSMLHENDPSYPDTGIYPESGWWKKPMTSFSNQVRHHCHQCGVPLRGYGQIDNDQPPVKEQTSETYLPIFNPKKRGREVEVVTKRAELGAVNRIIDYVKNAK